MAREVEATVEALQELGRKIASYEPEKVVLLGYSWQPRATHEAFGQRIRKACEESGRRVVYVASGDLSHRLIPTAPAGYDPQGRVFDEEIVAGVAGGDWDRIRNLPAEL